jgi:hypothetical protein
VCLFEIDKSNQLQSSVIVPSVGSRVGTSSYGASVTSAAQAMAQLTVGGSIQNRAPLQTRAPLSSVAPSSAPLAGGAPNIDGTKLNPWSSGKVLSGEEWHQAKTGMTFKAWDPNGKMHTQQYTPSEATSTSRSNAYETTSVASPVAAPIRAPEVRESKWAKPVRSNQQNLNVQ